MTRGIARNVVDRFFRIELGALAADLVEDVDEMRLHVEQAKFEHGEQAAGARADDQHVGLDRFAHVSFSRLNQPGEIAEPGAIRQLRPA